ncbi:MAG: DNA polymerase [Pseudobdellovibrionaceae bacterium]
MEFRNQTNLHSERQPAAALLNALIYYGLDSLGFDEKETMRNLAIRGGPYTENEKASLLAYCATDVTALEKLLPLMLPKIHLGQAILRGRYMKAVSVIEKIGIPIDTEYFSELKELWTSIETKLVEQIDKNFGVFEGTSFKHDRFEQYLIDNELAWPRTETGRLMLDEDTFHEMVRTYPQIAPVKELRHSLSQLRLSKISVGIDGRNRTSLSPFRAVTGRNQPSNAEFIFGPSCWIRGLIKPNRDHAIAYIDWSQQEFGIAAALSGDLKMLSAYNSGDPYLEFAKQAGAVPSNATKKTHGSIRDQFKACVLAVQYGMGAASLATRISQPQIQARHLLRLHRETYPVFWKWSDAAVSRAMMTGKLETVFGWCVHVDSKVNERSLRNFPMQANGAEMLRLACCLMVEAGIETCAPVHDAILINAPADEISSVVAKAKLLMEQASSELLGGFKLRAEEKIVYYPDRYMDERGVVMWDTVLRFIDELKGEG